MNPIRKPKQSKAESFIRLFCVVEKSASTMLVDGTLVGTARVTTRGMSGIGVSVDLFSYGERAKVMNIQFRRGNKLICDCHFENQVLADGIARLLVICDDAQIYGVEVKPKSVDTSKFKLLAILEPKQLLGEEYADFALKTAKKGLKQ